MKILRRLLSIIRKLFCKYCPKSKRIWLFGAWQGKIYADNTKYLYEYITKEHPEITAVWLTKSEDVLHQMKACGLKVYNYRSLKGIWYTARSIYVFETEGERDISPNINYKEWQVIQLWHGMGAKAMRWKNDAGIIKTDSQKERFNSYYWMSTSDLYSKTIGDLLQVDPSRFIITGYPRNDALIQKPVNEHMESLKASHPCARFIIYMPTHRNFGKDDYLVHNLTELKKVDERLRENNIYMVYKPHFHELKNLLSYEDDFTNIILAREENIWSDVYSYLHYFDALISDYSSITTDFMCTGKPVILFTFDLETYKTGDAGLNEYFWRIPGGPMCFTWDEVIDETIALLENDTWKEEREKCRIEYHKYNDGRNCERVYQAVMNIIT